MVLRGTFGQAVVIDPVKLAEFFRSEQGPVIREMAEDAQLVKEEAKKLVGVSQPDPLAAYRRGPVRRPGTLRDSIVTRAVQDDESATGVSWLVGSEDPVALYHHEGTEAHAIQARRAPLLVFAGRDGTIVRVPRVWHPGTEPNPFLEDALKVLGGKYGGGVRPRLGLFG